METGVERCLTEFSEATKDAQNLLDIHKVLNDGPGRRVKEVSLNRAVVVFTVAAWQAFIQDLTVHLLSTLQPRQGALTIPAFRLQKVLVHNQVRNFSTPSAEHSRDLLLSVGFDPRPHWYWSVGPETITPAQAHDRLNNWLRVRHSLAHGDALPDVAVLHKLANGGRSLRMKEATRCLRFFERLSQATADGASAELPA